MDEAVEELNFQNGCNESLPLLTYTLSTSDNDITDYSQTRPFFMQNSLNDDTVYLQDMGEGNTEWTFTGLPIIFTADGQPLLLSDFPNTDFDGKEKSEENITEAPKSPQNEEIETFDNILNNTNQIADIHSNFTHEDFIIPSEPTLTNSLELSGKGILTSNGLFISVDNTNIFTNKEENNGDLLEEAQQIESDENDYDLSELSELADVITAYKCKRCSFTCSEKHEFLLHFKSTHLEVKTVSDILVNNVNSPNSSVLIKSNDNLKNNEAVNINSSLPQRLLIKTNEGLVEVNVNNLLLTNNTEQEKPLDKKEIVQEKCILLCSQCSREFSSIEDCRKHMIEDHKLENKSNGHKRIVNKSDQKCILKVNGKQELDDRNNGTTKIWPKGHDNNNSINLIYECFKNNCLLRFDKKEDLLRHEKTHENDAENVEKQPAMPVEVKTREYPFKCLVNGCHYKFETRECRAKHQECHVTQGNREVKHSFKCCECNLLQKSWLATAFHLWREHQIEINLFTCTVCNYKTLQESRLKCHMKIHKDERSYGCPDCGRSYKQSTQLRNHRLIHYDKHSEQVPLWYREKECLKCHKIFSDSKCLKKHMQSIHSKLKPFICNVCGHSCARKAMLQLHHRQHTGEKPYACTFCDYKTGDHNCLRRHIMKHTGTRPYKCPHCSYSTIQSSAYKNHITIRHPGKEGVFACNICRFRAVSEEGYKNHIHAHELGLIPIEEENSANQQSNKEGIDITFYQDSAGVTPLLMIPTEVSNNRKSPRSSDSEEPYYIHTNLLDEQYVDAGGITIPADQTAVSLLQSTIS